MHLKRGGGGDGISSKCTVYIHAQMLKKTDKAIVQIMQIDRAERGRCIYYAKYYGGNGCWGKKIKNEELGKKLKKGMKKGGKIHEKMGKRP